MMKVTIWGYFNALFWNYIVPFLEWLGPELTPFAVAFVFSLIAIVPSWRLFRRVGKSARWSLIAFLPLGFFIVAWILALTAWPREKPN